MPKRKEVYIDEPAPHQKVEGTIRHIKNPSFSTLYSAAWQAKEDGQVHSHARKSKDENLYQAKAVTICTITVAPDGRTLDKPVRGFAFCGPEDTFDRRYGAGMARARAKNTLAVRLFMERYKKDILSRPEKKIPWYTKVLHCLGFQ